MRKSLVVISLICYMAATIGVVVQSHYCMKKLVSVELYGDQPDTCGKCGMDTHEFSTCCHTNVKVEKVGDDHAKSGLVFFDVLTEVLLPRAVDSYIDTPFVQEPSTRHFLNHSPPLLSTSDLYLDLGVFRI